MRRNAFRALVVAGAVMALSLPVLTAPNSASACSNAGCSVTITGTSTWDTFISPITATIGTAVFNEVQTAKELPLNSTVTVSGSVGFTVFDLRGNNQGFVAYLSCTGASTGAPCMTSSLAPANNTAQIGASQFSLGGASTVQTILFFGDSVGLGVPIASSGTLDVMQPVAGECPREEIGQGIYNVTTPLVLTLSGLQVEYLTLPVSWFGNFDLTIVEGTGPGSTGTPPSGLCPPFA
ncbi:MAG TPA: hypothetical protein VFE42_11050 [Chloroflexota bacterium]|nr:hypothetical protein [Chloroflexota bacterium]